MKIQFDALDAYSKLDGLWISLRVLPHFKQPASEFVRTSKNKVYDAELKQHRDHRSLDANAYFWVLLGKMADKLGMCKDELYPLMLERYGTYTHVVVKPEMVERVKTQWRATRELGEVTVNGQKGIQLQCYFGSSTYDTKEMSRLIDGVVDECKELDIETLTPEELLKMKSEWGS